MRIAVNTRFLLPEKLEGFGWYTHEVVSRMVKNHPEDEFIFFFDRKFDKKYIYGDNVTPLILSPQARHPVLFKLWFDFSVSKALKKHNADVFFSPDGYLSLRTNKKQVGVIHDINFEHNPQDIKKSSSKYLQRNFPKFARTADKILTVSEYSKKDISETYGVDEKKIIVGYNGVSDEYHVLNESEKLTIRKGLTDGQPYFVYVGALHPRKNIGRLLQAFDLYKQSGGEEKLVVVGDEYWWNVDMENIYKGMSHKDDVAFTGHLKQEELIKVMGSALALTYVSYYEGFGIPLVEAMKSGVPCITSDRTSLPEVAGDAALIVDPMDVGEIAKALDKMANDSSLRDDLIRKGLERVKMFSWDKTAEIAYETLKEVVNG